MKNTYTIKNWIEKIFNKEMLWSPVKIGYKHGRELYSISFVDGTEEEAYIDFENKEIERLEG